ncbi:MAG: regulatory iron-sulfur-containing complex subunit RicT, partial [Desulfovibrionaceae bacterium]
CGQLCCCRRFLRKFMPVTIKMAKEQNLFLNPTKISGICGRLLCCLSYEQEGYEAFNRACPKIGKRFRTARGQVKVLRSNFFRKTLNLLFEDGAEQEIGVDEWPALLNGPAPEPAGEAPAEAQHERRGRRGNHGRPQDSGRVPRAPEADAQAAPAPAPSAPPDAPADAPAEADAPADTHSDAVPDARSAEGEADAPRRSRRRRKRSRPGKPKSGT